MLTIIDYGMGNLRSVQKSLERMGATTLVSSRPEDIAKATALILPGVGSFGAAMTNLKKYGLDTVIKDKVAHGIPFLGICLGLQVLFEKGEESPDIPGLGILKGTVPHFHSTKGFPKKELTIPHMGWNQVVYNKDSRLFQDIPNSSFFYFVHSYQVAPKDKDVIIGHCDYGGPVVAAIEKDNVFATQFHPEKSSPWGMIVLKNFMALLNK